MPLPNRFRLLRVLAFLVLCPNFAIAASAPGGDDAAFREGWSLLQKERYEDARAVFAKISPLEYDLGDYVVYFGGEADAREGKRTEAGESLRLLEEKFPGSPLLPYLRHEVAYAAALDNDVAGAREAFGLSRGQVSGSRRKAEAGYVAAFLAGEGDPTAEAATLHLENFSVYPAREAGILSFERLWKWRADGLLAGWDLSPGFYAKFAKAAARAGEAERARALFEEAVLRFPPSGEYFALILEYAEFHRKQGETAEAAALLEKHLADAPPAFRSEARFLQARVEWKAGRLAEARKEFLEIAEGSTLPGTGERARYLAAWIAEDEGDLAGATESFERLRGARDDSIRREALFRYAYGLYRTGRHDEAIAAFEAGETGGGGTVERARHRYWRARALRGRRQGGGGGTDLRGSRRRRVRRDLRALRGFGAGRRDVPVPQRLLHRRDEGVRRGARTALGANPEGGLGAGRRREGPAGGTADPPRGDRLRRPRGGACRPYGGAESDRDGKRRGAGPLPVPCRRSQGGDQRDVERSPRPDASRAGGQDPVPPCPRVPRRLRSPTFRDRPPRPPRGHPPGIAFPVGRPLPRGRRGPDAADAPDGDGDGAEGEDVETEEE